MNLRKKIVLSFVLFISLTALVPLTLPAFTDMYSVHAAVSISSKKLNAVKGCTYTLKISGTSKKVTWKSSNSKIAKVDSKGKVTGVKKGTTTIIATVNNKKYNCKVVVQDPYFSAKSISLVSGKSQTLTVKDTTKDWKWKSSNTKVATVNSKGKVTATGTGTATITATYKNKVLKCTVKGKSPFGISKSSKTVIKKKTYTLKLTNTSKKAIWSTSNKKVATVSSSGKVTAVSVGTATITARIGNNYVTSKIKVEDPKFNVTSLTLLKDSSYTIKINGNTQVFTWKSSNSKVAKVDSKGKITAIGKGSATINATIGSVVLKCTLKVEAPAFGSSTKTIDVASIVSFPLNGTAQKTSYKSNSTSILKVDSVGKMYAIKEGSAVVTATVAGKQFKCTITVKKVTTANGWRDFLRI